MKPIQIEHLTKSYGDLRALDNVSVLIAQGELFFLLGPSGCGKTTLLRSIAGFVHPERGSIKIGGKESIHLPPQQRHTAMVFQSYALWPHMTVFENVAFGLESRHLSKADISKKTAEALALVHMDNQSSKKPNQLSGGQQQRIALSRALVVRPACLLLDEPLSNLDARLREEMRNEIRNLCKQNGLTGIYVTHDQKEALAVADRIAIMEKGRIVQIGTPNDLYCHPVNHFVASFLGQVNLLPGVVCDSQHDRTVVDTPLGILSVKSDLQPAKGCRVSVVIRPEAIATSLVNPEVIQFQARLVESTFLGEAIQQRIVLKDEKTELKSLRLFGGFIPNNTNAFQDWSLDPGRVSLLIEANHPENQAIGP